ncbi:MAG: TonB-dependent receptor plug domain-containing protein [Nitrospiraceae bacterium]|nr:TonB-dependent receptor plug domain-containing protein [Nitrospiraceae bacterium]
MNVSSATHACSPHKSTLIMSRALSVALGTVLMTIALAACIGPVKPVPTQQSQKAPPPPTETGEVPKLVESAPSDAPPPPPATLPVPHPPIGMGQPSVLQGEEEIRGKDEIPVVEAKPVVVAANRGSYRVENTTTATKTDTPIMETPVNIQVVPQQVLRDQQVVRLDKALQNVSGVYALSQGSDLFVGDAYRVRGFITGRIYRDGGLMAQPFGGGNINNELADIDRVEVLKGPASILYGRIEPGGLINMATKQPLAQPFYAMEQQFGSFRFYRTTVDATGPLSKDGNLFYRVNVAYENAGSFVDFASNQRVFVAPVLRWELDSSTQVTFNLRYLKNRDPFLEGIPVIGSPPSIPALPPSRNLYGDSRANLEDLSAGFSWTHAFNHSWSLRHKFVSDFLMKGIADNAFRIGPVDADGFLPRAASSRSQVSHAGLYHTSLDLTGHVTTWQLKHTLLIGVDYLNQKLGATFNNGSPLPPVNIFTPSQPVEFPPPTFWSVHFSNRSTAVVRGVFPRSDRTALWLPSSRWRPV